jgi:hypothetical protein
VPGWITGKPDHIVVAALAVEGLDYIAYLADGREVTEPGAGRPIAGTVAFALPAGRYRARFYSPTTGLYSPAVIVEGGKASSLELAPFRQDVVLRASRMDESR